MDDILIFHINAHQEVLVLALQVSPSSLARVLLGQVYFHRLVEFHRSLEFHWMVQFHRSVECHRLGFR